jgi:hypothetical protein
MNFLEHYLHRRNTTGNVPQTAAATVSFTDPDETEMGNSDLEGETRIWNEGRVKRSRN